MMMTGKKSLLIRADANTHIGTGHVMRCLALAQAWQDNCGTVTFLMAPGSPSLEQRIRTEGMDVLTITEQPGSDEDAVITAEIAKKIESSWVVVDGYQFSAGYQKILKEHDCRILFIDDYGHADHYFADIVLNQNIYADMSFYKKYEPYTRFLLGTKYVLLRREFLKWSDWHRDIPEVAQKILVTLGGSDLNNVTHKVIDAVKMVDIHGLGVIVVVGGVNQHFDLIHEMVKDLSNFTLIKNVENMPELMAWADVAISASGSTYWELAFMGLPSILCSDEENQKLLTKDLYNIHAAVGFPTGNLSSTKDVSHFINSFLKNKKIRSGISRTQKKIVDGNGAKKILSKIMGKNCNE
jgi:UDP-2,4-diacetamido-2,4,6-trideoxy-beta-L-altropyranose hydrolase